MIGRILVALDGSPRAPGVFAAASEIGRRFQAEIIPLRAIFIPAEFPPAGHVAHADPLRQQMIDDAERALGAFSSSIPDLPVAAPVVRHGQPWRVILEVADAVDADLIVMGSHGYHGFDRILGTTAAKVVNLAHRNVLVVHERDRAKNDTPNADEHRHQASTGGSER